MNAFVLKAYCGYIFLQNILKRKRVIVTSCSATKSKKEKIYSSSESENDPTEKNKEQEIQIKVALILCKNFLSFIFTESYNIHPFCRMKKLNKYLYPVHLRKRLIILKINKQRK